MVPEARDKPKERSSRSSLSDSFDSLSLDSQSTDSSSSSSSSFKSALRFIRHLKTDVKLHIGFEVQNQKKGKESSVRPLPKEASKWSNSFDDLINSRYGQSLFKAFLQREFCEENLEFWLAIEDYRKSSQPKLSAKAQNILNEFILPQSPKEINIDSVSRENLINKMSEAPTQSTLFDHVQQRIRNVIETDAYIRFLKSDLYLELLHPEDYSS